MPIIHTLNLRLANAYLIENQRGLFLIDTGMPGDDRLILRKIDSISGKNLQFIFITHAHIDHFGGATLIQRQTGAPIGIHHGDAVALASGCTNVGQARGLGKVIQWMLPILNTIYHPVTSPADFLFEDGDSLEKFGLNAIVVHTPGHTPGSSSLLLEDRQMFVGDLLSTNGGIHPQRYFATNWNLISQSLERLRTLQPKAIYPGHGKQTIDGNALAI
jgi:glyoxylase-like metal-dependent hydrolase (beta-lactamase superfamily II)